MTGSGHGTDEAARVILCLAEFGLFLDAEMSKAAPTPELVHNSSMMALVMLVLEGPTQPGEFARRIGLTTGGVTRLVERLESEGMVERRRGVVSGDARAVEVAITTLGVDMVHEMCRRFLDEVEAIEDFTREVLGLVTSLRQESSDPPAGSPSAP